MATKKRTTKKSLAKKPKKTKGKAKRSSKKSRSAAAKRGWETRRKNEAKRRARREHARLQRQERRRKATPPKRKARPEVIIPANWRRVILRSPLDTERMAVQVAQRIREKVIGVHEPDSYEAQIVLALIAAEQTGTFNEELYDLAGQYPDYDSPSEIYTLWLYSGN